MNTFHELPKIAVINLFDTNDPSEIMYHSYKSMKLFKEIEMLPIVLNIQLYDYDGFGATTFSMENKLKNVIYQSSGFVYLNIKMKNVPKPKKSILDTIYKYARKDNCAIIVDDDMLEDIRNLIGLKDWELKPWSYIQEESNKLSKLINPMCDGIIPYPCVLRKQNNNQIKED